ncbi:MAG: hypothetical protein ABJB85_09605 [Nitrososphaerota archaeon]
MVTEGPYWLQASKQRLPCVQREDDALGPSELVSLLGLGFAIIIQTGY